MSTKASKDKNIFIEQLQERIRLLEEENEGLHTRINDLQNAADQEFHGSVAHRQLTDALHYQETELELLRGSVEHAKAAASEAARRADRVVADNCAFMEAVDGSYWVGITKPEAYTVHKQLEQERDEAVARLDRAQETIAFLREYIRSEIYSEKKSQKIVLPEKTGRKSIITDALAARIQSYRNQGYTIRAISELEGISVGLVQKIVKIVKDKE